MPQKVAFISTEKEYNRRALIERILRFYAVNGIIEKSHGDTSVTWIFNIWDYGIDALQKDIQTLHFCDFDVERKEL